MQNYMKQQCNQNNNGTHFWKVVKPLISDRSKSVNDNISLIDNDVMNDRNVLCEVFNDYFTNVVNDIGSNSGISGYADNDIHACHHICTPHSSKCAAYTG